MSSHAFERGSGGRRAIRTPWYQATFPRTTRAVRRLLRRVRPARPPADVYAGWERMARPAALVPNPRFSAPPSNVIVSYDPDYSRRNALADLVLALEARQPARPEEDSATRTDIPMLAGEVLAQGPGPTLWAVFQREHADLFAAMFPEESNKPKAIAQ